MQMKFKKLESILVIVTKLATKSSICSAVFMGRLIWCNDCTGLIINKSSYCIVAKNKQKWDVKTHAFRTLEKSSVPPYSQYFHCNYISSKEDGSFVPAPLSKGPGVNLERLERLSWNIKWKILISNTRLKTQNSYKKSFTLG